MSAQEMEVIRESDFRAVDWLRDEHSPRFRKLRFVKWYKCDGYNTQDLVAAWKLLYEWVKETHRPVNYYAELQGMLEPLRRYEKKAKTGGKRYFNLSPLSEDSDPLSDISDTFKDLRRFQKKVGTHKFGRKRKVSESSSDSDPPSNDNRREPQPRAGPSTDKNLPSETAELAVSQQSKQRLDANEESGMDFSTSTELYPSELSDYHDDSDIGLVNEVLCIHPSLLLHVLFLCHRRQCYLSLLLLHCGIEFLQSQNGMQTELPDIDGFPAKTTWRYSMLEFVKFGNLALQNSHISHSSLITFIRFCLGLG